jgi:hypothetical protein
MKGIYLTEQSKQEIETKIAELEVVNKIEIENKWEVKAGVTFGCILILNEILSSAIILPVEESWDKIDDKIINAVINNEVFNKPYHEIEYPNGVIIQTKQ